MIAGVLGFAADVGGRLAQLATDATIAAIRHVFFIIVSFGRA